MSGHPGNKKNIRCCMICKNQLCQTLVGSQGCKKSPSSSMIANETTLNQLWVIIWRSTMSTHLITICPPLLDMLDITQVPIKFWHHKTKYLTPQWKSDCCICQKFKRTGQPGLAIRCIQTTRIQTHPAFIHKMKLRIGQ